MFTLEGCPTGPVNVGTVVTLHGTAPQRPTASGTMNGQDVSVSVESWDPATKRYEVSVKVPACEDPPASNLLAVTVTVGSESKDCVIDVNCP